jgi:hypothetical protein
MEEGWPGRRTRAIVVYFKESEIGVSGGGWMEGLEE